MPMTEFLALNPKCYSFRFQTKDVPVDGTTKIKKVQKSKTDPTIDEIRKLKGVSYATVANTLPFKEYKEVLDQGNTASRIATNIGSFNQQLFSFDTKKIALNAFYDKLYMIDKINCEHFGFSPTRDFEYYRDFIKRQTSNYSLTFKFTTS